MKRWLIVGGIALVAVVVLIAAATKGRAPQVRVSTARTGDLTLRIASSGLVETDSEDLSFRGTGEIVALYVGEGDSVSRGQVLARLAGVAGAGPPLAGEDVIASPFDGTVVDIYLRQGAVAAPGTPVLRVASSARPWVTAFMDADDAVHIQEGDALQCRAGGYLSRGWGLRVERIGSEAVSRRDLPGSARQVRVRCSPTDAGFAIAPGTEVDIDGEVPLVRSAVVVPTASVVRDGLEDWVWVVEASTVRRRDVDLGPNNFDEIAVSSGLREGETVVVEGKEDLKDGQRVKTAPMPPRATKGE